MLREKAPTRHFSQNRLDGLFRPQWLLQLMMSRGGGGPKANPQHWWETAAKEPGNRLQGSIAWLLMQSMGQRQAITQRQEGAVYGSSRRSFASQDYDGTSGTAPPPYQQPLWPATSSPTSVQTKTCASLWLHTNGVCVQGRGLLSSPLPALHFPLNSFQDANPNFIAAFVFITLYNETLFTGLFLTPSPSVIRVPSSK